MSERKSIEQHLRDGTPRPERHAEWLPGAEPVLWTRPRVAKVLGTSRGRVYELERLGLLRPIKLTPGGISRFHRDEVLEFARRGWRDQDEGEASG